MAVQATSAMSMIIADVPGVHGAADPARALFTLSILTGVIMLVAGLLRLGFVLRFVSTTVVVGFINAVGVNIVLGQLANFTGYASDASSRITRTFDTLIHPGRIDVPTLTVGVSTIVLIVALEHTPIGSLGLVVAVVATSAAAAALGWTSVPTISDLGIVPDSLPTPVMPMLRLVPELLIPAASLAFVGLVQGAGISANLPNPDGTYPDPSRDFIGQGAANVASGVFQGMPVGGSLSASLLNKAAGARSRQSLLIAGVVMAVVIVAFGRAVGSIAMPALAGLLMLIGYRTIKPADLRSQWKIGTVQRVVLVVTFALTMLIPLQYAVLVGVGLSVILYVVRQSNQVTIKSWRLDDRGQVIEGDPPQVLPANQVVVLQPYGSLFFASAPVFESQLPAPIDASRNSVVILRLRGRSDLGTTFLAVLYRYAEALAAAGSKLVLVSVDDPIREQLQVARITEVVRPEDIYGMDERVGATLRRAHRDAQGWVDAHRDAGHP